MEFLGARTSLLAGIDSGAIGGACAVMDPAVDDRAVAGLKFSAALPVLLARATVAERLGDPAAARAALTEPRALHVDAG